MKDSCACAGKLKTLNLIPEPVSVVYGDGCFLFTSAVKLVCDATSENTATQLANYIHTVTGMPLVTPTKTAIISGSVISFTEDEHLTDLSAEGYRIEITPDRIDMKAATQAGLFYAIQTFLQLLPSQVFSGKLNSDLSWEIPCAVITDYPRFGWRGLMLDTGHDYQQLSYIYRFIDLMAIHKFNILHWHITDLGTFPLEINGYPKLQDSATLGTRMCGDQKRGVKPGRYTQNEVREIVAYASARHITIVPEIDMPGHSTPVLLAYPEYDCPVSHKTWEFERWEYCVGNENTYSFLQEILAQVMELFPSHFIHIGGDECPKEHWKKCPVCQEKMKNENLSNEEELQSYFVKRIESFLNLNGRRLIGWDEIMEGGIAANAAVMAWRAEKQLGVVAAQAGHDVVMASTSHLYFDYSETTTPIEKVYEFEPVPAELPAESVNHILGAQAQMWTDNHPTESEIDRLVYPRSCAVAEVVWSPATGRDYNYFNKRLVVHCKRLAELGIDWS